MPLKKPLGKGLDALIPGAGVLYETGGVSSCGIEELQPGRYQARKTFTPTDLAELTESIKQSGIIQPLLVRKIAGAKGYEIIAGERRWRAAQRAGLHEVPIIVRDFSDAQAAEVSLLENLQRENLNPIEEAEAYQRLIEEFANTHEDLAQKLGKDRSTITNALRLLKLPVFVREALINGNISTGHARCLLGLSESQTKEALQTIIDKSLSVRSTEAILSKLSQKDPTKARTSVSPGEAGFIEDLTRSLSSELKTRVQIIPSRIRGKGKITITFGSNDELEHIVRVIRNGLEIKKL